MKMLKNRGRIRSKVLCGQEAAAKREGERKRVFVFGLGYTGTGLVNSLQEAGGITHQSWTSAGTTRTGFPSSNSKIVQPVIQRESIFRFDGESRLCARGVEACMSASHVLVTVPPAGNGDDPVLSMHLDTLASSDVLEWIGYLSSTSVYGDHKGAWVDEQTPTLLLQEGGGLARRKAEESWQEKCQKLDLPLHIFRLGGIYGPERSVLTSLKRDSTANQRRRRQQQYTSRIHLFDVCSALRSSMLHPEPGLLCNIVDDDPAPRFEVEAFARSLLGIDGEGESHCYSEPVPTTLAEKRVKNDTMKSELGVELTFPTYREGLQSLAAGDTRPF